MSISPESYSSPESIDYQEAIQQGIDEALDHIRLEYEQSPIPENNLDYHNTEHTVGMIRRVETILRTIQTIAPHLVSDKDIQIAKLAAANHDTVQNWQEVVTETTRKRQRFAGANEEDSSGRMQAFMKSTNLKSTTEVFSQADKDLGHEAIMVTVPGWDPEAGTVFQPNLTENSSLIARAIALADLNAAGMEGPEAVFSDTSTIFREDNLDIKQAMQQPELLTDDQKESYRQRMLAWLRTQSSFVAGRKNRLNLELQGIPEEALPAVNELFTRFDEAIEAMNQEVAHREALSFEELASAMGY